MLILLKSWPLSCLPIVFMRVIDPNHKLDLLTVALFLEMRTCFGPMTGLVSFFLHGEHVNFVLLLLTGWYGDVY